MALKVRQVLKMSSRFSGEGREAPIIFSAKCLHCAMSGLAAEDGTGAVPHGDAAGQDDLSGASVKGVHRWIDR